MPDLSWMADLGRASVAAFWLPVAAWSVVALVVEATLQIGNTRAALALPVRGALLAALPLAVLVPAALAALAPEAAQAVAAFAPPMTWLPEVAVGAAPEAVAQAGPAALDVLLGLSMLAVGLEAVVGLGRLAWALVLVRRTRQSLPPADAETRASIDHAREQLGVALPIAAAVAPEGTAPFTVGWRRPVVALPVGLAADAREVAAVHEVAHVRRSDFAWHAAQRAVTAVFAAHPLVWMLGRGLDLDRERAADAAVLDACPERRRAYADLLLSFASLPAPALALGAAPGASSLKSRIDAMTRPLSPTQSRRLAAVGRLTGFLALVLVAGLAATTASPSAASASGAAAADGLGLDRLPDRRALADRPAALVEGLVTDADTREGLLGASLQIVGTSIGAATDAEGRYRLTAPTGDHVLRVSAPGYVSREVALADGATRLDVALTAEGPARPGAGRAEAPDVFETVETPPVLIGGLAGLMERVVYPEAAKDDGVEGMVIVEFIVNEEGRVEDAEVRRSPDDRLAAAALVAVNASRFEPGRQRGEPVRVRFAVPVTFRLRAGAGGDRTSRPADSDGDGIFEVAEDPPQMIGGLEGLQARVVYPPLARNAGIEGQVIVQFVVTERGEVEDAVVLRTPHEMLGRAALDAVQGTRFEPGRVGVEPVRVQFAVPITFRLPAGDSD